MLSEIEQVLPSEIEKRSFEIITEELKEMGKILCPETELIVKRCIHTSADFEYADSLVFTEGVVEKAKDAIRRGVPIITDTQMGKAGINKKRLAEYGSEVLCFMSDEDVAEMAKKNGTTRAVASMDKAAALGREAIFAVGNAPTALVRLYELIKEGKINPELIISSSGRVCKCRAVKGTDLKSGRYTVDSWHGEEKVEAILPHVFAMLYYIRCKTDAKKLC